VVVFVVDCFDLVVFVVDCFVSGPVRQMLVIWWLVFGSGVEEFQICD